MPTDLVNSPQTVVTQITPANSAVSNRNSGGVTARVVVLCLVLAAVFGYIIPVIDYKLFNTFLGGTHLPPGAIGVLLVLLLVVNPLLKALKVGLSQNEALTVYMSCLFSCLIPGHGGETFVIPNLLAPFYYATRENKWLEWLEPSLKPWLTPSLNQNGNLNEAAFRGWYEGIGSAPVPWSAWLVPLFFWVPFVLVSYVMFACLGVMLRKQWAENEALTFPLLKLPLEMTQDMERPQEKLAPFFKSASMWIGFGIAVFIQGLRGLNLYYPDVPTFPLEINTGPLFTEAPWNQIGGVPIQLYLVAIAVAFLLTSEVSFSLWFFFWFIKLQLVAAYLLGFTPSTLPSAPAAPGKIFQAYQVWGCYLTYAALLLWSARQHLRHIVQRALRRVPAERGEESEVMSYPLAFWGFLGSFAIMVGATMMAGVRLDVALFLWVSYLVLALGLSRLVVEAGMLLIINQSMPLGIWARLLPDGWLSMSSGLAPASLFQSSLVYHMRGLVLPSFLHSFKLAHDRKISAKPFGFLLAGVIVVTVAFSWYSTLRLGYQTGGLALGHKWFTVIGATKASVFVDTITKGTSDSIFSNWAWLGSGALLTGLLTFARSRLLWFPLHPIGFLVCLVFPAEQFWSSIFLGWLFKITINRFGGTDSVRQATPIFLGLALGDVAMMLFWLLVDGFNGHTGHLLMPG